MKIAHVITGLGTGGAEGILLKLVQAGTSKFHHSVISLGGPGTIGPLLERAGADVFALNLATGKIPGLRSVDLISLLRRLRPDVLKGWMYHGNLAATVARPFLKTKPPLVWSIHCLVHHTNTQNWLTYSVIKSGRLLSRAPDAIVYNSSEARAQHEAIGFSSSRSTIIANGFDTSRYRPDNTLREETRRRLGLTPKQIAVGLVARLHPVKNHESFVQAAHQIAQTTEDVIFVAAGRGVSGLSTTIPHLRPLVEALGWRLRLLDEQQDVAALFNALDINVLCSLSESFPNVLGEAMACGVPCVATNVGECATIVGATGVIVPAQSANGLAKGILSLISDEGRRRRLGDMARARVESEYSIQSVIRIHEDQWESEAAQQAHADRSTLCDA